MNFFFERELIIIEVHSFLVYLRYFSIILYYAIAVRMVYFYYNNISNLTYILNVQLYNLCFIFTEK